MHKIRPPFGGRIGRLSPGFVLLYSRLVSARDRCCKSSRSTPLMSRISHGSLGPRHLAHVTPSQYTVGSFEVWMCDDDEEAGDILRSAGVTGIFTAKPGS